MRKTNRTFCVIGLTSFGRTIAVSLGQQGCDVMVLDDDEEKVHDVSEFVTEALVGDYMNETVLRDAGVNAYSCAVVCLSQRINDSILLTIMLKDLGVEKVVVRAGTELEYKVLSRIGADEVVFPEKDMGRKLAMTLSRPDIIEFLSFSSEHSIVERRVPAEWVGKSLAGLDLRKKIGVSVIALKNEGGLQMSILPQRIFAADDIVLLIGPDDQIGKL